MGSSRYRSYSAGDVQGDWLFLEVLPVDVAIPVDLRPQGCELQAVMRVQDSGGFLCLAVKVMTEGSDGFFMSFFFVAFLYFSFVGGSREMRERERERSICL